MSIPRGTAAQTGYKTVVVLITLAIALCVIPCVAASAFGPFSYHAVKEGTP